MKKSVLILAIAATLGACGGGNGTSGISGDVTRSEYEIWLEQGNKGSYEDYLFQKSFTKPEHSINENNLKNMSFSSLGSREFGLPPQPIKIQTNDNGDITSIEFTDYNDPNTFGYHHTAFFKESATYNFTERNSKYQSQTIYYYSLPIKSDYPKPLDITGIGFSTDKELTLAEIKEKFLQVIELDTVDEKTKTAFIASINALTESDALTLPTVCYDMNCIGKEANLGHYLISRQSLTMDVDAFGRDVGLKYSNFGTMRGTYNQDAGTLPRAYVFAGGQPEKAISKNDISGKMTFSGKAVGQVLYHYSDFKDTQHSYLDVAADAHLKFDNGTEELVMNFSDNPDASKRWYDVKIYSDANGAVTATISNGDKITDQNNKYKFSGIEDGVFPTTSSFGTPNYVTNTKMNTEYFGSDKNPTDVVGTATIYQLQWSNDVDDGYNHELSFFTAFGATKDK